MFNLLSTTDDFIKNDNLFNKTIVKQVLTGPDMSEVRVLVQFGTFQVPKWYFDEMTQ